MLSEDEAKFSQIQLRVFDRDTIRNEYMGELNFQTYQISDPFNTAADKVLFSFLAPVFSRIVPQWLPLHDKSGNHSGKLGEIQLRLGLSEDYLPETSQDRINLLVHNLDAILFGELDELTAALQDDEKRRRLEERTVG